MPPAFRRMLTPARVLEIPNSRCVTCRVQPPEDWRMCPSAKEKRRFGSVPESVDGGLSMSGFSRSRVRSRGPGSVPPVPGERLGCGTCGAVCPMAAVVAVRSPPAAPTASMSRREIWFMMLSRLQSLPIACNRKGVGRLVAEDDNESAPLGGRVAGYVLIQRIATGGYKDRNTNLLTDAHRGLLRFACYCRNLSRTAAQALAPSSFNPISRAAHN